MRKLTMLLFSLLAFVGVVRAENVAKIGDVEYETLQEAAAVAKSGDVITLLADTELAEKLTLPAGITLDGNGKQISGEVWAGGNLTFVGHTKVTTFNAGYEKPVITIGKGACLEMNGSGRMVIGHGATFNITGNITDAKTADVTHITPSLVMAGASFTGAGLTFNATNAYIKATAYCSSKNSNASGTFDFNIENSIWEQTGSFVFSEPTNGKDPVFNFELKNSVLNSTSHLVFAVTKGEIVIDNSLVNEGTRRQIENRSNMTIKNGAVVYGAVATSSNAKNPGTLTVENATYNVTGEFTGSDVGTGTLVIKKGANITIGSVTKANIVIDAADMTAGELANFTANLSGFTGTLEVINNDKLEAKIVDGKIVLVKKPAVKIGEATYATLAEGLAAASNLTGDVTVELYDKVTLNTSLNGDYSSIKFVGKVSDAEIYLDVQGYITASGKNVAFENLILSKSEGGFIGNAGFMNVAFGVYEVSEVNYTGCTFANGSCASSGKVTYTGCTFKRSHDKYGLWAYGNVDVTVDGCTFADYRGIKMYAEGGAKTVDLTVKNTDFSAVYDKPAIVLTYGESVTLENNTYSSTGVFELDLDGAPNGTPVTFVGDNKTLTCKNDAGACGVLVDGKIYTTVAQAYEVATSGSKVTLLHNSTETVEFPMGVVLDKNGYEAAGVTVVLPVAKKGEQEYATLAEAINGGGEITLMSNITVDKTIRIFDPVHIKLNGYTISRAEGIANAFYVGTDGGKISFTINDDDYKASGKKYAIGNDEVYATNIVYTRTFGHNSWQVLYVPFAIPVQTMAEAGIKVYTITGIDEAVNVKEVSQGDLSANTPYIVKADIAEELETEERVTKSINVTGTTLYGNPEAYTATYGNFTINGTYSSMAIDAESQYVLTNGKWCQLTEKAVTDGNNILGAFRVYLTANGEKNTPSEVRFVINNSDATAIDELKAENGNVKAEVYDLSGRRVEKAVKGIYVVNGKKVVK